MAVHGIRDSLENKEQAAEVWKRLKTALDERHILNAGISYDA